MKLYSPLLSVWRLALTMSIAMHYSLRIGHHILGLIGMVSLVTAAALWGRPQWREALVAHLMPIPSTAVQTGYPLYPLSIDLLQPSAPPYAPGFGRDVVAGPFIQFEKGSSSAFNVTMLLDFYKLPSAAPLARKIPARQIVADARDDWVLVSHEAQARVTRFLARRYSVAERAMTNLVQASFTTGREVGLDPLLLLAVMAIESRFNPYAESRMGAQGLMQVMSKVHIDKLGYFGGLAAALQPLANIKVGALILKDCIARGGSLVNGLRLYNGSALNDHSYSTKVLTERRRLRDIAANAHVFIHAALSGGRSWSRLS